MQADLFWQGGQLVIVSPLMDTPYYLHERVSESVAVLFRDVRTCVEQAQGLTEDVLEGELDEEARQRVVQLSDTLAALAKLLPNV